MDSSGNSRQGIELDRLDLSTIPGMQALVSDPREQATQTGDGTDFIQLILKKIMAAGSFLSFSLQIHEINKMLRMKYSSAGDIADVIAKDVALTSKFLKLANASFYGQFGDNGVSTISEAMILLGTEEIKQAAASLKIFEFMQEMSDNRALKDKTLTNLMRSVIAREIALAAGFNKAEEFQICAMLYDLGEYIVMLFTPDNYIRIEMLINSAGLDKEEASKALLGVSYSRLGRIIAEKWGLPEKIINSMKPVSKGMLKLPYDSSISGMQRYVCAFSDELCSLDTSCSGRLRKEKLEEAVALYGERLGIGVYRANQLILLSKKKIKKHAALLGAAM